MVLRRWGVVVLLSLVAAARPAGATGVPIDGFLPLAGISLTREFIDDFTFAPVASASMTEPQLGPGGVPHYDVALLDTGAAVSLLNSSSNTAFGINTAYSGPGGTDGFRGTEIITIGGATGFVDGDIMDPLGLYAGGLQSRTAGGAALVLNNAGLLGQTNTSMVTVPPESDLPNILGLSYLSQYATRIRSDLPQVFELGGQTVRTPSIEFLPRGSGGMGITRKAPLSINGDSPVTPQHLPNIIDFDLDQPWEDPFARTFVSGGLFLNVNAEDDLAGDGGSLNNFEFFFDTGASVTVVSELNALRLGFDVQLDKPEFTLAIVGSGGTALDVPGFFVDEFTIQAIGGNVVAQNVPVVVLDIVDPSDPNNVIDGFVGTNLLAGRNLVIDPNPAISGGPSAGLYISDPVTTASNWSSAAASASWGSAGSWSPGAVPGVLNIANVRHTSGGNQEAVVSADAMAGEVNVSGTSASQQMMLTVENHGKVTTFAGLNIEAFGHVNARVDSVLDVQYVDIRNGGRLSGRGSIFTGSGPIPGQVENASGVVSPGPIEVGHGHGTLNIEGRYSNGAAGALEIEIAGFNVGFSYDQLAVTGPATLAGTLRLLLPGEVPFVPPRGWEFTILTASDGISGEFDILDLAPLPAGHEWHVAYEESEVIVKTTFPGDFDGDVDVDGDDLAVWQAGYGTTYSGADFLKWQQYVGSRLLAAPVPEPASAVLLAMAACGAGRRARRKRRG